MMPSPSPSPPPPTPPSSPPPSSPPRTPRALQQPIPSPESYMIQVIATFIHQYPCTPAHLLLFYLLSFYVFNSPLTIYQEDNYSFQFPTCNATTFTYYEFETSSTCSGISYPSPPPSSPPPFISPPFLSPSHQTRKSQYHSGKI